MNPLSTVACVVLGLSAAPVNAEPVITVQLEARAAVRALKPGDEVTLSLRGASVGGETVTGLYSLAVTDRARRVNDTDG